ncbi:MAG: unknown protein [Tomato bushy stunt virus satellite RNA C]|nr:MAG: unknown protein [Tomato bushy stunt virus satellite RNA C]
MVDEIAWPNLFWSTYVACLTLRTCFFLDSMVTYTSSSCTLNPADLVLPRKKT